MTAFIHEKALCESTEVGTGTRVWAFAHILPGAKVGRDCNICDGVFIENDVVVGDRTTVKCGVQLWDGVRLGDDVFVGPNATFTNDLFPRSGQHPERYTPTIVEDGASIGANATILAGITIGRGAMVGAGAVVTRSVPPNAIVVGNPARIRGYSVAGSGLPSGNSGAIASDDLPAGTHATGVKGVQQIRLPVYNDVRGNLTVGNFADVVPFTPARFFMVYGVPSRETRGEHAHRVCAQFLICTSGSVRVLADDGCARADILLDSPHKGLLLPPMTWGTQYEYSTDAVLLVFASHAYDNDDYIRTYDAFLALSRAVDA